LSSFFFVLFNFRKSKEEIEKNIFEIFCCKLFISQRKKFQKNLFTDNMKNSHNAFLTVFQYFSYYCEECKQYIENLTVNAEHLKEIDQSYFVHARDAMELSFLSQITCVKLAIHAIFPNCFKDAGTNFSNYTLQKVRDKVKVKTF